MQQSDKVQLPYALQSARPERQVLGALIVLFLLLTIAYALALPVFEGFDAQAHYTAATFYRDRLELPTLAPETVEYSYELITQPPLYFVLAGLAASGWPVDAALKLVDESANPYFNKSLSYRQSVLLPDAQWEALAPAWIARFVSMAGGLLTLLGAWWLARILFPRQMWLAVAAVSVAAFNPQFLYILVSITNDGWAAGTAALTLALAARATVVRHSPRAWLWVGLALGLAGLTKYSALLVAAPVGLLWLLYWRQAGWRAAVVAALWTSGGFLVLAGWWFVRNLLLYGEIVPFARMAEALPTMRRPIPYDLPTTMTYAPWLVASFWGVFVAVIAPGWYLELTRWFMVIGFGGLLPAARWLRQHAEPGLPIVYLVLLPWLLLVALSVLYWTSTVDYGEQGRLAHIGASAFGLTMAVGWSGLAPDRWRTLSQVLVASLMLALALAGFVVLRNAFALPPALAQPFDVQRPVDARFTGGMQVVGIDFPHGAAVEPGGALPITLYFTTDAPIRDDYTLFVHLAGDDDELLYQFDGVPVRGGHPTRQWRPGQVFADSYEVTVPTTSAPGLAVLSVGFYPLNDVAARQPVYDAAGNTLGDRLVLAKVRIAESADASAAASPDGTAQPLAVWRNGIVLREAIVAYDAADAPQGIVLEWSTYATLNADYTTFVQVLDAEDRILAQVDRQPQHGDAPTSTWRAGDRISDVLSWESDTRAWVRIIVGLYDAHGVRLEVVEPALLPHAVEVATARTSQRNFQPVSIFQPGAIVDENGQRCFAPRNSPLAPISQPAGLALPPLQCKLL